MSPELEKNLVTVCAAIEKKYGKGSVMKLTDQAVMQPEDIIPSGSIELDTALGIGGYKKGRIIEMYGPEGCGKTTLALHAIAQAQSQGDRCALIDAEHSLNINYAKTIGVDFDDLTFSQPDYGEQALDIADMLVRSGALSLIVIDSVAALIPKAELDGDIGDQHVGRQARLMSQAMRKLAGVANSNNCAIFFINQTRMKIGVMFGSPITTSGGNALKFYASQRLDMTKGKLIKDSNDNIIGSYPRVKVVKNKLAPPYKNAEFELRFGVGIDKYADLLEAAVTDAVINKSGAWYSYKDSKIGQGKTNVVDFLKDNPEIEKEIREQVTEGRGLV